MTDSKPSLAVNATRDLAGFAARLEFQHIPPEAVARAKQCVLDAIGCCLFGVTLPWTRLVQGMVEKEGGNAIASIFGSGKKTSISQAVLVNSTAGHAFELDDMHMGSSHHPGSIAIPVAIAFAEAAGAASGRDVLTAGSQAGGLMAAQEGAMVKRFHSGRAAQSGAYSALLAQQGFTGIGDVLEASYGGYLSTFSDKPEPQRLTAGLGTTWEILKVGFKPHATVTSIHTALDALAAIMREHRLKPDDISRVSVGITRMTHIHCAWEYKGQGVTAAQMNLAFGMAVVAIDGMAFVDQYSEDRIRDPKILDFVRRVDAYVDAELEAMDAAFRHGARVTVHTCDGRTLKTEILRRRGSAEVPLDSADIEYKFRNIVKSCLPPQAIDQIIGLVAAMDELDSVAELIDILAAPART
ncbi:MAG: MmgE/PrpD family protein [Betaproteobacteria bacterium]|nr:MmgE/PrpD family protein [Betaproteobacteria bacterium]